MARGFSSGASSLRLAVATACCLLIAAAVATRHIATGSEEFQPAASRHHELAGRKVLDHQDREAVNEGGIAVTTQAGPHGRMVLTADTPDEKASDKASDSGSRLIGVQFAPVTAFQAIYEEATSDAAAVEEEAEEVSDDEAADDEAAADETTADEDNKDEPMQLEMSTPFKNYMRDHLQITKKLNYIGLTTREEVFAGCRRVAIGQTTMKIEVEDVASSNQGDTYETVKVERQKGCTYHDGSSVELNRKAEDTSSVFAVLAIHGTEHFADCAYGVEYCHLFTLGSEDAVITVGEGAGDTQPETATDVNNPQEASTGRRLQKGGGNIIGMVVDLVTGAGKAGAQGAKKAGKKGKKGKAITSISMDINKKGDGVTNVVVKTAKDECFPAAAMVVKEGGVQVRMDELQHGERVLTVRSDGQTGFEAVYLFGHRNAHVVSQFVEMKTSANTSFRATPDHYIHVVPAKSAGNSPPLWKNAIAVPSGLVKPGDYVFTVTDKVHPVQVTHTKVVFDQGLYNPYTMNGNIVVDGHSASCHSGLAVTDWLVGTGPHAPAVYQAMWAPLRLVYRLNPGLLRHVDNLYSRHAWERVSVAGIAHAIMSYRSAV